MPDLRDSRIRVLLYIPCVTLGGTEQTVFRIATGLDPRRFEPMVAWSDAWGMLGEKLLQAGIPVHRIPLKPHLTAKAIETLRGIRPDVFHSFNYRDGCSDVVAAAEAGVPAIVSSRGNARFWDPAMRVRPSELARNRLAHAFTACCEAVAWVAANVEHIPFPKISVVHNGVHIPDATPERTVRQELGLAPSAKLIGYVASYRALKGHDTLLRAFRRVLDRDPNAHLVCCGDDLEPGTRARLLALARKLRLENNVSLLPEREDVETVYAGLDLYVQASRSEGLSNALLEAMAHGVAVVATSVGGTAEAIADGVEGRLVPAGDVQSMGAAMVDLLGQPDLAARYGSAGRERVRTAFCIGTMLRRYECLYRDTLAARSAAKPIRIPGPRPSGRPLRILYRLDVLCYGGLEKQAMNLALGLDRSRFEPVVCWSRELDGVGARLREAGIAAPQVKLGKHTLPFATDQIRQLGADIFHSFSCARNDRDARAASQAGIPVIVTNRGNVRHWDEQGRLQDWETRRNGLSHAITACCEAVAWVCCNVERVPFSKIAVLYNGVAIPQAPPPARTIRDELGIAPGTFLLGYVANYRRVKGHDGLLRAFRKLIDRWPQAHLVCCGADNNGECPELPGLAAQLGLNGRVSLLGARDDVDAVYRGLDLYVHPSKSEGLSNAILEAMAHGLPVVATSVGGTAEAVEDGVTGYLAPPGDEEALCLALGRLMDSQGKRRRFGREARDRAERKFSLAAMVEAYSQFYERMADRAEPFREGAANAAADSPG